MIPSGNTVQLLVVYFCFIHFFSINLFSTCLRLASCEMLNQWIVNYNYSWSSMPSGFYTFFQFVIEIPRPAVYVKLISLGSREDDV